MGHRTKMIRIMTGPGAMIQSCRIEDNVHIGAGAVVMEGALVEQYAQVAEGAVVHPGRRIPSGQVSEPAY